MEKSEPSEVVLERKHVHGVERFQANEHGIAVLKAEFLVEAEEYLYLRKGEDFAGDVIGYVSVMLNALSDGSVLDMVKDFVVYTAAAEKVVKYYPAIVGFIKRAKERFAKAPWKRRPKDLHLLLWPDETNERARPLYEEQGYEVRFYGSENEKGVHRLYLNEKRYCLFLRTGKDGFVGFIGKDVGTREALKDMFEKEWGMARPPR